MAKKEDTAKEVVEKKTVTAKLDKKKQERTKKFSRILYVIARIEQVLMAVAVVCLALLMIVAPVVVKNVKVEENMITVFGQKISYDDNGEKVILYFDKDQIETLTNDEKAAFDYVIKELKNTNITKVFCFAEFTLVGGIALLVIGYIVLGYFAKLFNSIFIENTPFISKNLGYLQKITKLSLISVIVTFACDALSLIFFGSSIIEFDLSDLVIVLLLYVITYIFEYACMLQNRSKSVMFSDIGE